MKEFEGHSFRRASMSQQPGSYLTWARRNWISLAAVFWLVISIRPVVLYWSGTAVGTFRSYTPQATVTTTIAIPALRTTALANAIPTPAVDADIDVTRISDVVDGFKDYKRSPSCNISALELHGPFAPLCRDKASLLEAMTNGGRIGVDAPYSPRGCDMRWFHPSELCTILDKFHQVTIVGDSIMRNIAVALHMMIRADLVNGGKANWVADPPGQDCSCAGTIENRQCTFHSVVSTQSVWSGDAASMFCPRTIAPINYQTLLDHPFADKDFQYIRESLEHEKQTRPHVFILGHGLWNDLDKEKTFAWVEQVEEVLMDHMPYLHEPGAVFPRLFMTPNAAGEKKPEIFVARQGNIALSKFEHAVGDWIKSRDMDFLGTYNMTIQTTNPDGTHGSMKTNLIKAMMVFNWLNSLDLSTF